MNRLDGVKKGWQRPIKKYVRLDLKQKKVLFWLSHMINYLIC